MANNTVLEDLITITEDNKTLKQENDVNIRQITRLQISLDKSEKDIKDKETKLTLAQKEYKDLSSKLSEAAKKLVFSEKKISQVETEAEKRLESIRKSLAEEKAQLNRLSKFSVPLTPVPKDTKEISTKLNSIFISALSLTETYFSLDFPPTLLSLQNTEIWDPLKDHKAIMRSIPLPLSNSPTAKSMRVASFLSILNYELRKHIFQPTYLLKDFSELNNLLNILSETSPEEESYLRSVLLKTSGSIPGRLAEVTQSCAAAVVGNILNCVTHLIPEAKRPGFKNHLEKLCRESCNAWASVQRLEGRVEFDFDAEEEEEEDEDEDEEVWKPLTLRTTGVTTTQMNTAASPPSKSRNTNNSNNTKKPTVPTSNIKPPSPPLTDVALTDPIVIWPSIYYYSELSGGAATPVLSTGYFLPASQITIAQTEQKQLLASAPHRLAREKGRRSRALSFVGGPAGMNGEEVNSRSGFLGGGGA
ncbi:hypothetical protein QBC38DRAFT_367909 [Podospora fimiseda]|uniref:MEI5 protein n=1 Tax=Podospora fimiseda TaxID=252190 RepID=A0AAN7BM16_9PEZI|nr:hypothetical protein QBC38DRAFT_367909 [Podospora fimiseda]